MDTKMIEKISIVIPVYAGETTLPILVEEIKPLTVPQITEGGIPFVISELILVHDCGPNSSHKTIQKLCDENIFIQAVWLTKNYGQHPATLAGIQSSNADWVVTIDEDGQQNPADIPRMLDFAIFRSLQVVYARPTNPPPHGPLRNLLSKLAKKTSTMLLGNKDIGAFNSFRLLNGEIAKTLANYCKNGVYLDIGLSWVAGNVGHFPLRLREELDRPSSYSFLKLLGHFWRLILTTGTRPLRLITFTGILSIVLALCLSLYAIYGKYVGNIPVEGWTSLVIVVSFFSGSILAALGIIAEYLAVSTSIAMGKPMFIISTKPTVSQPSN